MVNDDTALRTVVRQIHDAGIRFVLVGGMALIAHGGNDVTQDVDISPAPEKENRDALAAFLRTKHARPLGFPPSTSFTVQPEHLEQGRLRFLNLKTDLGAIDVLPLPDGVDSFEGLWKRAVEIDLGGFVVRIASLEDLAAMKRASGRPKDLSHLRLIESLIRLRNENRDETNE